MVEFFLLFHNSGAGKRRLSELESRVLYTLLLFVFSPLFFLLHSWIKIMFQRGRDGFIHIRLCVGAVFGESFIYY